MVYEKRRNFQNLLVDKGLKNHVKSWKSSGKWTLILTFSFVSAVLPLKNIWKFEENNKQAVLSFNKRLSETETKCSICVYFSQRDVCMI